MHAYFLVYGFLNGGVERPFRISPHYEEFNALNERILYKGDLEVSALSAVNYWRVADEYYLLRSGSTQRFDVGAVLVGRRRYSKDEIRDLTVAVPGKSFSAYFYFRLFFDAKDVVEVRYDRVIDAVLRGEADLGLLIPGPMTASYERYGLVRVASVFDEWRRVAGDLPMPMGVYVARRKDFTLEEAVEIRRAFQDSIRYAQAHSEEALAYALQFAGGADAGTVKGFIDGCKLIYDMGEVGRRAILKVYELARERGLISEVPEVNPI